MDIFGSTVEHREAMVTVVGLSLDNARKLFQKKYPTFTIVVVWDNDTQVRWYRNDMHDNNRLNVGICNGKIMEKWNEKYFNGQLQSCGTMTWE